MTSGYVVQKYRIIINRIEYRNVPTYDHALALWEKPAQDLPLVVGVVREPLYHSFFQQSTIYLQMIKNSIEIE